MLLTQAGRVRLGNMVDPKYTLGASILKKLPAGLALRRHEPLEGAADACPLVVA